MSIGKDNNPGVKITKLNTNVAAYINTKYNGE